MVLPIKKAERKSIKKAPKGELFNGGWGEIRTHGGVTPTPVFKTGALNHSTTHPCRL